MENISKSDRDKKLEVIARQRETLSKIRQQGIQTNLQKIPTQPIQTQPDQIQAPAGSVAEAISETAKFIKRFIPEAYTDAALTGLEEATSTDPLTSGGYLLTLADQIPEPPRVLSIAGKRTFSGGDLSLITGLAKSRKTLLAAAIARAVLTGGSGSLLETEGAGSVLYIDTEQSDYHAQRTLRGISGGLDDEAAARVTYAALRRHSRNERLFITCDLILKHRPALAILDGIADLLPDTNSNTDAPAVTALIMALAAETGTHICSILHTTNQNSTKARGHIGSELERKCEAVILVMQSPDDPDKKTSLVKGAYTRNEGFPQFYIRHGSHGEAVIDQIPTAPTDEELTDGIKRILKADQPQKVEFFKQELQAAAARYWKDRGCGDLDRPDKKIDKLKQKGLILKAGTKGREALFSFCEVLSRDRVRPADQSGDAFTDPETTSTADNGNRH